jgi:hypothetical protein
MDDFFLEHEGEVRIIILRRKMGQEPIQHPHYSCHTLISKLLTFTPVEYRVELIDQIACVVILKIDCKWKTWH